MPRLTHPRIEHPQEAVWPSQEEIAHYARFYGCSDESARRGLIADEAKRDRE